jgi:hypothetical protein
MTRRAGAGLIDLGGHRLKGPEHPERIYNVAIRPPPEFPPLKTLSLRRQPTFAAPLRGP